MSLTVGRLQVRGTFIKGLVLSLLAVLIGVLATERAVAFRRRKRALARATGDFASPEVHRAAFAEGKVWVVWGDGHLSALEEGATERRDTALTGVRDVCAGPGGLWAVTQTPGPLVSWTLQRKRGEEWQPASPPEPGIYLFEQMNCEGELVAFFATSEVLVRGEGGRRQSYSFPRGSPASVVASVRVRERYVLAFEGGEFGGGLAWFDPADGRGHRFTPGGTERVRDLLGGSINDLVVSPRRRDCVIAAPGLEHLGGIQGSLVEICGEDARIFYEEPFHGPDRYITDRNPTMPFYRLAATHRALIAWGIDELFILGSDGSVSRSRAPRFDVVGGLAVSFAIPSVVLIARHIELLPDLERQDLILVSRAPPSATPASP